MPSASLVNQYSKGGISRSAPRTLACTLPSLPPILHILHQFTMPSYSKGSRGLTVRSRVSGIFTATSISPSPWLRQRPNRYTIRAGRNLPVKEFRSVSPQGFPGGWTISYLTTIHLCCDGANFFDAFRCQMFPSTHQENDASELLEVHALLRFE